MKNTIWNIYMGIKIISYFFFNCVTAVSNPFSKAFNFWMNPLHEIPLIEMWFMNISFLNCGSNLLNYRKSFRLYSG